MRNVTRMMQMLAAVMLMAFVFATQATAQSTLLTEGWESAAAGGQTPPTGWTYTVVSGSSATYFMSTGTSPTITPYEGSRMAQFRSYSYSNAVNRLWRSTPISTVGYTNVGIDFQWSEDPGYSTSMDKVDVQWSTDGATWTTAATFNRYNAVAGWKLKNVTLPAGAQGQATLYIAFLFTSAFGNNCYLDIAHVTAVGPPPPATITVGTGTVSCNYPYTTYWMGGRTQLIYTAAQMTAAGASPGQITSIGFNIYSFSSQTMTGFNINMKNTTLSTLTQWETGMQNCYTGTYAVPATGWQMITLQTPFIWDGSNLLLEICFGNNGSYTSYSYCYGTTAPAGQIRPYWADYTVGCTYTGSPYSGYTGLPNLRFVEQPYVGTLTGTVINNYNSTPMNGATVTVTGMTPVLTNASGVYTIYNVPIGNKSVTASMTGFVPQTKQVTIQNQQTSTVDFALNPIPAVISGVVTNASNGNPVVGAKIWVSPTVFTYSIAAGAYTLNVYPGGNYTLHATKPGFDQWDGVATNYTPPTTYSQNINLLENTNPPSNFVATLNGAQTAVDLTWAPPNGNYELIYDDGVGENFTVWATAGNRNAVKFTPLGYPCTVTAGQVNIGTTSNYPSGANPLTPFQMAIYDATGPGGTPGSAIDTVDVTPTGYGWVDFTLPPTVITSGSFYLVMIQGGNAPDAAGVLVDETAPQLRSYASFNNGPWIPAGGNFMIRAIVYGTGGPLLLDNMGNTQPVITGMPNPNATYASTSPTVTGTEGAGAPVMFDMSNFFPANSMFPTPELLATGPQPAQETEVGAIGPATGIVKQLDNTDAVLYNNGPMVNSPGTGAGGLDESVLYAPLTTLGFNANKGAYYRMADDFAVTGGQWSVTSIDLYAYQTSSGTTSSITGAFVRIWSGTPGQAGSTVVWGDTTTNRMTGTNFANIYRVGAVNGGVARPIMKVTVGTAGLTLNPGNYWLEYYFTGSASLSGPWAPPITITGTNVTGNALQYQGTALGYQPAMSGTTYQQGVPFIINGTLAGAGTLTYQIWRLKQGEETTPAVWTDLGTTNALSMTDNSWPSLSCGPYRWAAKAIYPGTRLSPAVFSNVIGKCWVAEVTVNVTLTCAANPKEGTIVKLVNNAYPDTMYVGMTDTAGQVIFPAVWKGNYTLTATRFTYPLYTQVVDILGDMTIDVTLLQTKTPPTNLFVDDRSLESIWNSPRLAVTMFSETWASGNFTANQWVVNGGNWSVTGGFGNPAPSLQFYYSPTQTNYNMYVTSKNFTGIYSPQQLLKYDIYLSNYSTTNENTMAIELWDGATWHVLKTYTNMNGSFPWTSETLDISAYNDITFKIRFHAAGVDSYDINNWNIDNISIIAGDGSTGYNPCVLGYNFYLNTVLVAFTTDTTYTIPPNLVQYGTVYNACVNAVYGSGYSTQTCYQFTAHYLYPPRNLEVEAVECSAYLTWEKPVMVTDAPMTDMHPRTEMPNSTVDYSPMVGTPTTVDYTDAIWDILFSWNNDAGGWPGVEADNDYIYLSSWSVGPPWFEKYEKSTGVQVSQFSIAGATAIRDMASDGQYFYGSNASANLYKMDFATQTLVSTISTGVSGGIRHIAYDPNLGSAGGFWCGNWTDMKAIDMTGAVLWTGSGFTLNNGYGDAFDDQSAGGPYLWTHTQGTSGTECTLTQYAISYSPIGLTPTGVTFNVLTVPGSSGGIAGGLCTTPVANKFAIVPNLQLTPNLVVGLELADYAGPGGTPPGLIGYNVYRDGAFIAYVSGPDTTWYYDLNLDPDTYEYAVTAKYDLTDYGFPGQFDESLIEGPESVDIVCGRPIPFYEPWDQASYGYNDWTFAPNQGNWVITTAFGNPAPTADFSWQPMVYDYSYALESPVLNAGPWTCAALWFDFDYKLEDRNATGDEKLSVEVFYNGTWHQKAEYANNGSVNWTSEHFDISSAQGKALKVRFVAYGAKSEDILHWYVDNIHVYGICNAPVSLTGDAADKTVTLTWVPPTCEGGGGGGTVMQFIFDDGSAENGWAINPGYTNWIGNEFPIASTYEGVIQSFDVWFGFAAPGAEELSIDVFDATQTVVGSSDPFLTPNEDWVTVNCPDIPFQGMFYGMVKWDMLGGATNYFGIDEDGPYAADDLEWYYDGTTWDKFSNMGYNAGVMLIRATALVSGDLKSVELVAGKKPTGHSTTAGALVNHPGYFDTKNYGTTGVLDNNADSSQIIGYNVYRQDPNASAFLKVAGLLTATTYTETVPDYGLYHYYVTSNFNDSQSNTFLCESPSDTIPVDVIIGVPQLDKAQIKVYPNPATEVVNVNSEVTINKIEVTNFVGQAVMTTNAVDSKTAKINVTTLRAGVYFVKITTTEGVYTTKITVTH